MSVEYKIFFTKDSVGEKLLLEGGVPGVADDEGSEHRSNTSSGSSDTHSGGSSSDELGGAVNVLLGGGGVQEGGGLGGGGPHPGHGEAGRHGEAGDGRHLQLVAVSAEKILKIRASEGYFQCFNSYPPCLNGNVGLG